MLPVLLFALVVVCLVFVAILVVMFLSVAFQPPRAVVVKEGHGTWILPLLQGDELRKWSSRCAQDIVTRHLCSGRGPDTAVALVREIERAVTGLIDRVAPGPMPDPVRLCPTELSPPTSVTPPEALAIATCLQRDTSQDALESVYDRLRLNVALLADAYAAENPNREKGFLCPLLDADGRCLVWDARPIHCRSHCPECVALGKSCATNVGTDGAFSLDVGRGALEGLTAGLSAADLDGSPCEFNSALLIALETPGAATRWAHGDPVFPTPAERTV